MELIWMRYKLLIELIIAFRDEVKETKTLDGLKMRFTEILSRYEVSERCTTLQAYNYFPNEAKRHLNAFRKGEVPTPWVRLSAENSCAFFIDSHCTPVFFDSIIE